MRSSGTLPPALQLAEDGSIAAGNFIPLQPLILILTLCFEAPEEALDLPGPSSNPAVIDVTLDDSDVVRSD